jgi:hypothetical protein
MILNHLINDLPYRDDSQVVFLLVLLAFAPSVFLLQFSQLLTQLRLVVLMNQIDDIPQLEVQLLLIFLNECLTLNLRQVLVQLCLQKVC